MRPGSANRPTVGVALGLIARINIASAGEFQAAATRLADRAGYR